MARETRRGLLRSIGGGTIAALAGCLTIGAELLAVVFGVLVLLPFKIRRAKLIDSSLIK